MGLTIFTIITFMMLEFTRIAADWFAGEWGKQNKGYEALYTYALVYLIFLAATFMAGTIRSFSYAKLAASASFNIFNKVIWNVLRRPMSFFDTTASGTIMYRCTDDVNLCDNQIPSNLLYTWHVLFGYLGSLIILSILSPIHILIILTFILLLLKNLNKYVKVSTDLGRLYKLSNSPILSKVSEIYQGYVSIRAFQNQDFIKKGYIESSDLQSNTDLHNRMLNYYLRTKIDYPMATIISVSFLMIVFNIQYKILLFDDIAQIGLIITYIMGLLNNTGGFIWTLTAFMKLMSSVERI
jgi:ABC-type multidrug transport system fused ATPase/permease subunit